MPSIFIGVAGLPRAGSTLLCQLLAQHPEVDCEGHSSPLCNALRMLRRFVSDDDFMLAQLDAQFDRSYGNLHNAMRGFLHGWHAAAGKSVVVDKSRAWLNSIDMLLHLDPGARLLIPIRELGQIYGSIEAQHQKTVLLDFADHLADFDRLGRADQLFAGDKAIGAPLASIRAVADLPQTARDRLYFVKFEDLMRDPAGVMSAVFAWAGLPRHDIDCEALPVAPHESDSHYRFKYPHHRRGRLTPPRHHDIPASIQERIETVCDWYYAWFYPSAMMDRTRGG